MLMSLPAMQFRGGTSKGLYLLRDDLTPFGDSLDAVLSALMGGAPRQVDGLGGDATTTSKVAIVGPSAEDDIDVDYLFAQVDPKTGAVDMTPTCGNILAGVGPFAIERGLVPVAGATTDVRIRLVNTGARVVATIQTPNGAVEYGGDQTIAGVSGSAAPVQLTFTDFAGGTTGALFPTGQPHRPHRRRRGQLRRCGRVRHRHAGRRPRTQRMPRAPPRSMPTRPCWTRVERIRRKAGELMGMGDVSGRVVPKVMLVSALRGCRHPVALPGSDVVPPRPRGDGRHEPGLRGVDSRHRRPANFRSCQQRRGPLPRSASSIPAAVLELAVTFDGDAPVGATITSTARKLFDGNAFVEFHYDPANWTQDASS